MALSSICEALIINNLKKINKILLEVVQHCKHKNRASILGAVKWVSHTAQDHVG